MSGSIAPERRAAVAIAALVFAGWLFSPQIAAGLVIRGDDFMYRNDIPQALRRYERAFAIDRRSEAAADRLVFFGMQNRTRQSLRRSIDVATDYLAERPDDPTILADRALCYLIERRYALALTDFARAGRLAHDPRYLTFAGWAAHHARLHSRARALWIAALAVDPHFFAARRALEQK